MNLQTTYMGLHLRSPIVVSACSMSEDIGKIVQMEDAGAGAVVLFSLFEEQIRHEQQAFESLLSSTTNIFAEASGYFPDMTDYNVGAGGYLELIRRSKEKTDIPIIASLNCVSPEGWIDFSRQIQQAGADALEINVFFIPGDFSLSAQDVERVYLDVIAGVKSTVTIPVAVKLNPYFSSTGNMAQRLVGAGANGLVLFNRFYQPDFDIDERKVLPNLQFSAPNEIRLPLLWIALLHGRTPASLAATTGVHSANEVVKYLLAGADVTMTASALYKNGISYLKALQSGLEDWMEQMEYDSVEEFRGAISQQNISDPTAYERANYIKILKSR